MSGVTYDAGAPIAVDRNERGVWALHAGFHTEEAILTVPTPVIAEAWRTRTAEGSPRLSEYKFACRHLAPAGPAVWWTGAMTGQVTEAATTQAKRSVNG